MDGLPWFVLVGVLAFLIGVTSGASHVKSDIRDKCQEHIPVKLDGKWYLCSPSAHE